MCVAIVKMSDVAPPTTEVLRACWFANPHGGGVAWREGEGSDAKLVMVKGLMTLEDFLEVAAQVPENSAALYHTRIVSVGKVCEEQTHPFYTNQSETEVLVHNGTYRITPYAGMSDTQTVAEYCMTLSFADRTKYIDKITREAYCRTATLSKKGSLIIYGNWTKIDGLYFSNTFWKNYLATNSRRLPWVDEDTYYADDHTYFWREGGVER